MVAFTTTTTNHWKSYNYLLSCTSKFNAQRIIGAWAFRLAAALRVCGMGSSESIKDIHRNAP